MKNRFIVLVEFSEMSHRLLHLVSGLSKKDESEILILHQLMNPIPTLAESEMTRQMKSEQAHNAVEELKQLVKEIIGPEINVSYHVSREHLAEQIQDLGDPEVNDFIIAGIKPKEFPENILPGSTASKLIDYTDRILFAVPDINSNIDPKTLCVAIHPKYPFNHAAFIKLLRIQKHTQNIVFVTVSTTADELKRSNEIVNKASEPYFENYEVSRVVLEGEEPWTVLDDYLQKQPALLVLQRGSRNLSDILRRFFVNRFIYSATRPLVVLP